MQASLVVRAPLGSPRALPRRCHCSETLALTARRGSSHSFARLPGERLSQPITSLLVGCVALVARRSRCSAVFAEHSDNAEARGDAVLALREAMWSKDATRIKNALGVAKAAGVQEAMLRLEPSHSGSSSAIREHGGFRKAWPSGEARPSATAEQAAEPRVPMRRDVATPAVPNRDKHAGGAEQAAEPRMPMGRDAATPAVPNRAKQAGRAEQAAEPRVPRRRDGATHAVPNRAKQAAETRPLQRRLQAAMNAGADRAASMRAADISFIADADLSSALPKLPADSRNRIAEYDNGPFASPAALDNEAFYIPGLICPAGDKSVFDRLMIELDFHKCWLNTGMPFTREICLGDEDILARAPTYKAIVERVSSFFGVKVVRTLVNLYRDGEDWCNLHSDQYDQGGYPIDLTIGSSFGDTRRLIWVEKGNTEHKIELPQRNGDIFAFSDAVNSTWRHMIPREGPGCGPRISVIVWATRYKENDGGKSALGRFPHMLYFDPRSSSGKGQAM